MITPSLESRVSGITAACRECGLSLTPVGPLSWSVALPANDARVHARLEAGWLLLDGPVPARAEQHSPWALLQANALLAGPGKFALGPGRRPRLRAEIPADDTSFLSARVRAVADDFAHGAQLLAGPGPTVAPASAGRPAPAPSTGGDAPAPAAETLGALCESAGWTFIERSRERLMIALEVPDAFVQASVERVASGTVCVSTELARFDALTPLSRRALAYLLLHASGLVHMARAAARVHEGEGASVGFEVRLELPLTPAELNHALLSLTAAARLCGREISALRGERLARTYLDVHESGSRAIRLTEPTPLTAKEDCHAPQ